jgi:hypothetical protein
VIEKGWQLKFLMCNSVDINNSDVILHSNSIKFKVIIFVLYVFIHFPLSSLFCT